MRLHRFILVLAAGVGLSACGGVDTRPVQAGFVATEGVKITAVDDSFTLAAGQEFKPPFQVDLWGKKPFEAFKPEGMNEKYQKAIELGARKVRVTFPNVSKPFYGVLLLNSMAVDAKGPASRLYRIDIPDKYVQAGKNGQISVVYELVDYPKLESKEWYAWILWLSDHDFGDALPAKK